MVEAKKHILTSQGMQALEDELQDLKVVKRKEIAQKIKEAREQGDLSENAEYDAAKDEQRSMEARIEELEKIIKNAGNEKRVASYTKKINAMRGALCWAIENITSAQWWIRGAKCTDYGAPVCDAGVGGWSAIFTKYLEDPDMNFISNFLDDIK